MTGDEATPPATPARLEQIRRLCREAHDALTPAERDELLQLWIAQGMSSRQRAEMTRMLSNAAIALHQRAEQARQDQ
jgi:hypothetical protein